MPCSFPFLSSPRPPRPPTSRYLSISSEREPALLPFYRTMAQGVTKLKKKKQPSTASATKSIKRSTCSLSLSVSPRYLSLLSLTSQRRVDRPAPKKTTSVDKIRKKFSAQTIRSIESFAASKVMANKGKLSVVRADPTVLKKVAKHKEKLARQ